MYFIGQIFGGKLPLQYNEVTHKMYIANSFLHMILDRLIINTYHIGVCFRRLIPSTVSLLVRYLTDQNRSMSLLTYYTTIQFYFLSQCAEISHSVSDQQFRRTFCKICTSNATVCNLTSIIFGCPIIIGLIT